MSQVAVIQFPGLNCEAETKRSLEAVGLTAELVRWNQPSQKLKEFQAFIIPGGFSYEDRSRSGVIAALDPIMKELKKQAKLGKPILGICNGAQILVESGLVPGLKNNQLAMALAVNKRVQAGKVLGTGFYNNWIYVTNVAPAKRTPFTGQPTKALHLPVAHGEGRFLIPKELLQQLQANQQIIFQYCDDQGRVIDGYPENPNGSLAAIAGIGNQEGNVLALMPHPERSPLGFGRELFLSLAQYLNHEFKLIKSAKPVDYQPVKEEMKIYQPPADVIEFFVDLVITDNEAVSVANALAQIGLVAAISKKVYWQIEIANNASWPELAVNLIKSSELINTNKETVRMRYGKHFYSYDPTKGLTKMIKPNKPKGESYIIFYRDDFIGQGKAAALRDKLGFSAIIKVKRGLMWQVSKTQQLEKVLSTNIFFNPVAQVCYQYSLLAS